jgi:SAM-dependent methyltransferase
VGSRWHDTEAPRGDDYDARWRKLAAAGQSIHGEADLIESLLRETGGTRVLDAGCGTGRVATELAARGYSVVGIDLDDDMLAAARTKAPELHWVHADLADATAHLTGEFDVIAMAGNVMIFVDAGTEGRVLKALNSLLAPHALLVAGFSLQPAGLSLQEYDRLAQEAGLEMVHRWATWDQQPYDGGSYAVSVHRRRSS